MWRVVAVGAVLGTRPRPVLKHLLEASAEPNLEALTEVVAGVELLSLVP